MTEQAPENKLTHPCFPQPQDTSLRVWRYLDLAKFIWVLENQKLWLSRLDSLKDPHEGSTPRLLAAARDQLFPDKGWEQFRHQERQINRNIRTCTYVSCWHLGNAESEAMWRLYCPDEQGLVLQTSYKKLVDSIANDLYLYIGCVTYIDYEHEGWFPDNNMFLPVMHKRVSFAHEQEVRLVKVLREFRGLQTRISPPGLAIDWLLEPVIEAIYINPYAPEYYSDVVRAVVRRFAPALEDRVCWSRMRSDPVY
jgi:hypothetical protein